MLLSSASDQVYPAIIKGKEIKTGVGIHDSSASLVPYLQNSVDDFILVSTGTWCISMNPFPLGIERFSEGLEQVDLAVFADFVEVYTRLVQELTQVCIKSIKLIISRRDSIKTIYIFLITPTGIARWDLKSEDLVQIKDGKPEEGKTPSRSTKLHQMIYEQNPNVNTIIITQSP